MNLCVACRDMRSVSCSGMTRAMGDLACALAQEGHTVHLLIGPSTSRDEGLPGVAMHPVIAPPPPQRFTEAWRESAPDNLVYAAAVHREVSRIHATAPVDAVLVPLWRSEGAVCLLDDRFPTVVSCMTSLHTLVELDPSYHRFVELHERLALEREAMRRARYLHGLTEAVLAKTIADFELRPALTAVIGRGLQDRRVSSPKAASQETLSILFVGRIEQRKGVDTLLEATCQLVEGRVPVSLTLVGVEMDASYRAEFATAASHEALDAVRFAGPVTDDELSQLYASSDIVCVPSRYESHGIVVVEAMMFGKPIVSCVAGGLSEVVEHEGNGLLCLPDDPAALAASLRRLYEEPDLRRRLGGAGPLTYERRFEARSVARQMAAYLERAAATHRGLAPEPSDIATRLSKLIEVVLGRPQASASRIARELVGPALPPWRGQVRVGMHRVRRRAAAVRAGTLTRR